MGSKPIGILVACFIVVAGAHAATPGFLLKEGFPVVVDTSFSSLEAVDYDCSSKHNALMASSSSRVKFFSAGGEKLGEYIFDAPVHSLSPLKLSAGRCTGTAGVWDGKVYNFFMPESELKMTSYGKRWEFTVGERAYTLATGDFDGNGYDDKLFIGTGSYTDKSKGNLYLLEAENYPLNSTWKYRTSSRVSAIATFDLMGDGIASDVAVGYEKKLDVLNFNGSLIWSLKLDDKINALAPADFDGDGALTDFVVGAGNTTLGVNSYKEKVWDTELSEEVVGIAPVDTDNNGILDHHIVATKKKLYALERGRVLWEFEPGIAIEGFTTADFDGDGIGEDIALTSGNALYAYDFGKLYLPELNVAKRASAGNLSINVTLSVENAGEGYAWKVRVRDSIPEGLELAKGKNERWLGAMKPGGGSTFSYLLSAKPGNHTLPPALASYYSEYGRRYSAISEPINLSIREIKKEENETGVKNESVGKPSQPPRLTVSRSYQGNLTRGGNISVDVLLRNIGKGEVRASFEMAPARGVNLSRERWEGRVKEGEVKYIGFVVKEDGLNESAREVVLPPLNVSYSGGKEKYFATAGELVIPVAQGGEGGIPKKFFLLPLPVVLGLALLLLKKKYPHRLPSFLPGRGSSLPGEELESLEREFVKLYLEYQERGERPTYGEVTEKLGINMRTAREVVKKVENSEKYTL